jgi:hypothetical protein
VSFSVRPFAARAGSDASRRGRHNATLSRSRGDGAAQGARRPSWREGRTGVRRQWFRRSVRACFRRAPATAEATALSGCYLQLLSRMGALFDLAFETMPLGLGMRVRVEDYRREAGSIVIANPSVPDGHCSQRLHLACQIALQRRLSDRRQHGVGSPRVPGKGAGDSRWRPIAAPLTLRQHGVADRRRAAWSLGMARQYNTSRVDNPATAPVWSDGGSRHLPTIVPLTNVDA